MLRLGRHAHTHGAEHQRTHAKLTYSGTLGEVVGADVGNVVMHASHTAASTARASVCCLLPPGLGVPAGPCLPGGVRFCGASSAAMAVDMYGLWFMVYGMILWMSVQNTWVLSNRGALWRVTECGQC